GAAHRSERPAGARDIQGVYALRRRKPALESLLLLSAARVLRRSGLCEAGRLPRPDELCLGGCGAGARRGDHTRTRCLHGYVDSVFRATTSRAAAGVRRYARLVGNIEARERPPSQRVTRG